MKKLNKNLLKYYGRQEDVVLHRMLERCADELIEAFDTNDQKKKDIYQEHKKVIKKILSDRHPM